MTNSKRDNSSFKILSKPYKVTLKTKTKP